MTFREAQAEGTGVLARAAVETPSLDASLLLAFAADLDRASLLARHPQRIEGDALSRYRLLVGKRAEGACVAYLVGNKEFRGLDFQVTPDVLVPRPDTETLVEAALSWIDERPGRVLNAVDVCTGSGCVAIALKAERPGLTMTACDVSERALAVAEGNAARLLGSRTEEAPVHFLRGDLLAPARGPFDLVVANPPYVPSAVVDGLSREVRGEPRLALDGGADGLHLIRRLIAQAVEKLSPGGRLFLEAGHGQADAVAGLMREAGLRSVASYRDLAGVERVTGGSLP